MYTARALSALEHAVSGTDSEVWVLRVLCRLGCPLARPFRPENLFLHVLSFLLALTGGRRVCPCLVTARLHTRLKSHDLKMSTQDRTHANDTLKIKQPVPKI